MDDGGIAAPGMRAQLEKWGTRGVDGARRTRGAKMSWGSQQKRDGGRKDRWEGTPQSTRGNLKAGQLEGISGCGVTHRLQLHGA